LYNQRFKDLRDSDGAARGGEGHDMSKKLQMKIKELENVT
jgi:hypothetical protein